MSPLHRLGKYLATLSAGRMLLWFYFLWYLVVVVRYFDGQRSIWLTAMGLSAIIGAALFINTVHSGSQRVSLEPWPTARLFLFPFCVSSFSSLVKGRGFFLVFSPRPGELLFAAGLCAAFFALTRVARRAMPLTDGVATPAAPDESPTHQISR